MSAPLPATLIAGFGAAAKAPVIEALLRAKPVDEQWALIAPPGLLGARYAQNIPGVWAETVAPGCPCCTGLTPFSTGLTALLRRLRGSPVTRLLIEGGSEGHVATVARLLARDEFKEHVKLVHAVAVINPQWLDHDGATAQEALRELATDANSLVAHPWEESPQARTAFGAFAASLNPPKPWTMLSGPTLASGYVRLALPPAESGASPGSAASPTGSGT